MDLSATFAEPDPVAFSVSSSFPVDEAIDILGGALAAGVCYETESRDPRYLGLAGSVAGHHITLLARPYIRPGEPQIRGMMPIRVRGEFVSADGGSEIRALATAPLGRAGLTVAVAALIALILLGLSGGPFTGVVAVVGGGLMATGWTWIVRHNQRSALGRVDLLAGILTSIVNQP